jgi:hypothetical protein
MESSRADKRCTVNQELEIVITAPPDRARLAEIWIGGELLAELGQGDDGNLIFEFSPRADGTSWRLEVELLLRAIETAREKLAQPSPFRVE